MRVVEQVMDTIPKRFHVFIQDRGAYKHYNVRFASFFYIVHRAGYFSTKIMLPMLKYLTSHSFHELSLNLTFLSDN
jgi:hypothetical protein